MKLTQEAANQLFESGSFCLISGLPPGSEVGIDADNHVINKFSGFKLIPPGIHLITYSPNPSSSSSTSTSTSTPSNGLSIRQGFFHSFTPKSSIILTYNPSLDTLVPSSLDPQTGKILSSVVETDLLKGLDKELAPYPFVRLPIWKALVSVVEEGDLRRVFVDGNESSGSGGGGGDGNGWGKVDSLSESPADDEGDFKEVLTTTATAATTTTSSNSSSSAKVEEIKDDDSVSVDVGQPRLREDRGKESESKSEETSTTNLQSIISFPAFDLKRSWRSGAVGEEITQFSRDKSWLLTRVVSEAYNGDPSRLVADLQLSFLVFLDIQNFSALLAYKRLLTLFSRSASTLLSRTKSSELISEYLSPLPTNSNSTTSTSASSKPLQPISRRLAILCYDSLLKTLHGQLASLPQEFFSSTALAAGTGLEGFWVEEIEILSSGIRYALKGEEEGQAGLISSLDSMIWVCEGKFGWSFGVVDEDEEEDEEEGEYAPAVVEI